MTQSTEESAQIAEAVSAPPAPKKLTDAERLGVENTYLKMQNLQLTIQGHDMAKSAAMEQLRQLQKDMEQQRLTLSEKYGVDISRTNVHPDGTIDG